jgi:predicted nucleotidyltransferase component of viral defense system
MQDLIQQEKFELEVLDELNSKKLLGNLVFGGGTMLRLCWGLNRFSVDLDFWVVKDIDFKKLFTQIENCLKVSYVIIDSANKFYTLLFEIKSKNYPRALKIEIRKGAKKIDIEKAIAFSKYSNSQVILNTVFLDDMMRAKIEAILDRKEIRDAFDIEFLLKKGIKLNINKIEKDKLLKVLISFKSLDFSVKLGSLLESQERKYYIENRFKILVASLDNI